MDNANQERDALIQKIEAGLRERLEFLGVKAGSRSALVAEANFISGAMIAINAFAPSRDGDCISAMIPPRWIICLMRGQSVLEPL